MPRLHQLPDDVLIQILAFCRINSVLALRATCRNIKEVISDYEAIVCRASAELTINRNLFGRLFALSHPGPSPIYNIRWLKSVIPKYLASVLAHGPPFRPTRPVGQLTGSRKSVDCDEETGDGLRARLENGWNVIRKMELVAKNIYEPRLVGLRNHGNAGMLEEIQRKLNGRLKDGGRGSGGGVASEARGDARLIGVKEQRILDERLKVVASLSEEDAHDVLITIRFLHKAFRLHPRFDDAGTPYLSFITKHVSNMYGVGRYAHRFDWPGTVELTPELKRVDRWGRTEGSGPLLPWMIWFVLHTGTSAFFEQWTASYVSSKSGVSRSTTSIDHVANRAWSLYTSQTDGTLTKRIYTTIALINAIRIRFGEHLGGHDQVSDRMHPHSHDAKMLSDSEKWAMLDECICLDCPDVARIRDLPPEDEILDGAYKTDWKETDSLMRGEHPLEAVPFFIYLGRVKIMDGS